MLDPSPARRTLRYGLPRLLEARPPIVWTAALLYLCGGLACLAAVVFPISSREPVRLDLAIGVLACATAAGVWTLGRRLSPVALAFAMALGSLAVSAIVANARTSGGAMLAAYAYPWIAVYTAHFCSRRAVIAQSLLISVGFGAGLIAGGLPNMGIDWVIVTGTVWSTALVLGRLSDNLRQRADTDPLTGLLNRNGFLTAATRERAIADRTRTPLTLAVLDLDGFKQVNDRFGHAAGDRLLADTASTWRARLRAGDILARHGGDEFVLLLPATSQAEAGEVLERLRGGELPVGWSIGLSEWLSGERLDAGLARADRDLYSVKRSLSGAAGEAAGTYRSRSLLPST
jgi:diguanylate cyclase (GGDEF)-like protein